MVKGVAVLMNRLPVVPALEVQVMFHTAEAIILSSMSCLKYALVWLAVDSACWVAQATFAVLCSARLCQTGSQYSLAKLVQGEILVVGTHVSILLGFLDQLWVLVLYILPSVLMCQAGSLKVMWCYSWVGPCLCS